MSLQNIKGFNSTTRTVTGFEVYDYYLYYDSSDNLLGEVWYEPDADCDLTERADPPTDAAEWASMGAVYCRPANTAATATVDNTKTKAVFALRDSVFAFTTA